MEFLEGQTLSSHLKHFWSTSSGNHSTVGAARTTRIGRPAAAATLTLSSSSDLEATVTAAPHFLLKTTRELTTHNALFVTPDQRDAKPIETFNVFQHRAEVIAAHVARFQ